MAKKQSNIYMKKKTKRMVNALNSMSLETVLDWLCRAEVCVRDGDNLGLAQYLVETKEVIEAEQRMKKIQAKIDNLSFEDTEKRRITLKREGVVELI
jgi:hypothetical protein